MFTTPKAGMVVNARSTGRFGFKCGCCQSNPGKDRKVERRQVKRAEKQAWKREVEAC